MPALERRILTVGAIVLVAFALLHGLNHVTFDGRFLAVDLEANLFTWTRTLAFAAAGVACWLAAIRRPQARTAWRASAIVLVLLSLDETVEGHNWLEQQLDATLVIVVVIPVAAILLATGLAAAVRRMQPLSRWLLIAAGAALVAGQLVAALNASVDLPYAAVVLAGIAEQLLEAAVPVFALAAAWRPAVGGLSELLDRPASRALNRD